MKKRIISTILILGTLLFGQNLDSREGDSLALVAIKKANPNSKVTWDLTAPMNGWAGVSLNADRVVKLDFMYMQISSLPTEIHNLQKLNFLSLYGNQLTKLPTEFWQMKSLDTLDLSVNSLTTISDSIEFLQKIKKLGLSDNKLTAFPVKLCNLANLEFLSMSSCGLRELPTEISKLSMAHHIDLSTNSITRLPAEICSMKSLWWLSLDYNPLEALPENIGDITTLGYLYLENVKIRKLPESIGNCTGLTTLWISGSPNLTIPSSIGKLIYLTTLNLESCGLTNIPKEITNITPSKVVVGGSGYNLNVLYNNLDARNLDSTVVLWLNKYQSNWQKSQTIDPSPILPQTTTTVVPLTATISETSLKFSGTIPMGSTVSLFTLSGRKIAEGPIVGKSFALPVLARGVYVVEISAGTVSVVQKISIR